MDLVTFVDFFSTYGYFAVFGMLILCGFGLPLPEDISLVAGGVISGLHGSTINPHLMFLVGFSGVIIGDLTMFSLGYIFGEKILKNKFIARIVTPQRYLAVQASFEKYGKWVLFMARFMPGLRSPIFVVAGVTRKVSYIRFFCTDGLAALISVPFWVYLGYFGANNLENLEQSVRKSQEWLFLVIGIIIILLIAIFFIRKFRLKKNSALINKLD